MIKSDNDKKKYYKILDFIRIISCIAVFLYHLNILKGGYLAVCVFFVLTGYFSCVSAFKKDNFSLKEYYYSRFKRIYLPLLFVVFLSIAIISIIPSINWLTMKPESLSVLLGYNNYWQIGANVDYFARHVNSPFMHLWYIGILVQFELIFPFIFIGLKKLEKLLNKKIICILLILLSIVTSLIFYISSLNDPNIMNVYYNTYNRIFSIIMGITTGFIIYYYKSFIPFKNKKLNIKIFGIYLVILLLMFIFVDSKSILFPYAMILSSLITCRMIDYSTLFVTIMKDSDKNIRYLSNISYEIYLFQYPVIFIFQYIMLSSFIKLPIIIIITILLSILLHEALSFNKKKLYRVILLVIFIVPSIFGIFRFIIEKDHTEELNVLKEELNASEKIMKERQIQYKESINKENEEFEKQLKELENGSNNLGEVITNLPIIGIGDSVMLGAVPRLSKTFVNGYFDAKVSRSEYAGVSILKDLADKGMLTDTILIHLGNNGSCGDRCRDQILDIIGNRKLFFMTVTNDADVHVNSGLKEYINNHSNCYLVDWYEAGLDHPEYFAADKLHLNSSGMNAYSDLVYNSIYNVYKEEFDKKKEEMINNHNNELKDKITIYGNDLLLNAFKYMKNDFTNADFEMDKDFTYDKLINSIKSKKPNYNVLFVFDDKFRLNNKQYNNIIKLLNNNKVYILKINNDNISINNNNVKIIDFYKEISKHNDYLMIDNIHLTDNGNIRLNEVLKKEFNK